MLHARRQLLPDIAALVEGDAVKFIEAGVQREHLVRAEVGALWNAEREAMQKIAVGAVGRRRDGSHSEGR